MDIPKPLYEQFTVYSKSGCINCTRVKQLLQEKQVKYNIIDCDEYILEDKSGFLDCIRDLAEKEYKMFPMVFFNKSFIGGFKETEEYFQKTLDFSDEF
jgi:glutaredoxin